MGMIWRWGVGCGLVIALADLVAALSSAGQLSTNETVVAITTIDLIVNIALYSYCGFRVASATTVIRDAAEAGVIAGSIVGAAVVVSGLFVPPLLDADPVVPITGAITSVAFNVAMGGVLATLYGFVATLMRRRKG